MISYARLEKFQFEIASTYNVMLNGERFLKGIGGIRIWFFFAGTFIMKQFQSDLKSYFIQIICGT